MAVGKIQANSRGILQFLSMIGTGVSPTDLSQEVQANLDTWEFYAANYISSESANANVSLVAESVSIPVPQGQTWFLRSAQAGFAVGAGAEQLSVGIRMALPNNNSIRIASSGLMTAVAATARLVHGVTFPQPILMRPGMSLEAIVEDIAVAAPRSLNLACVIYRLSA